MRGRSRNTFSRKTNRLLRGIDEDDENADMVTRANWLRAAAGHHTRMANKLIMVTRYMKNKTGDVHRTAEMRLLSYKTAVAYNELAGKLSKREKLSLIQQDQFKTSWMNKASKQQGKESGHGELQANIKIDEVQTLGSEVKEALEDFETCDLSSVIHAAK